MQKSFLRYRKGPRLFSPSNWYTVGRGVPTHFIHIPYKLHLSHVMRKPVLPYANNKGPDQPAHPRSLISAFVVRCLDSIIPLLVKAEISRPELVSVVEQAGLSLTWSKSPKTGFLVTWLKIWYSVSVVTHARVQTKECQTILMHLKKKCTTWHTK